MTLFLVFERIDGIAPHRPSQMRVASATTLKVVLKPVVYLGLVADGEIWGIPASVDLMWYIAPEFIWPTTPEILASASVSGQTAVLSFGVSSIIFNHQFQERPSSTNGNPAALSFFNGQHRTVFVVLYSRCAIGPLVGRRGQS